MKKKTPKSKVKDTAVKHTQYNWVCPGCGQVHHVSHSGAIGEVIVRVRMCRNRRGGTQCKVKVRMTICVEPVTSYETHLLAVRVQGIII